MRTLQQAFKDAQASGAIDAWLEGKEIQYAIIERPDIWHKCSVDPNWNSPYLIWRPKPLTFPEPPEGEKWHNPDNITPDQLGEGYRLLLESEITNGRKRTRLINRWDKADNRWLARSWAGDHKNFTYCVPASTPFHWDKPKPKIRVPLGPEDVPPGSVFRRPRCHIVAWITPVSVLTTGIQYIDGSIGNIDERFWVDLVEHWQILRPGRDPFTGWEPCWKEVEEKEGGDDD